MDVLVKVSRIFFVFLVVYPPDICAEKCTHKKINRPRGDIRCVTGTEDDVNLTSISRHQCQQTGLIRSYSLINYNYEHAYCLMTNDRCIWLEMANGFEMVYYGATGAHCLEWVPNTKHQQSLAHSVPIGSIFRAVARYVRHVEADVIPGFFYFHDNALYVVGINGQVWYSNDVTIARKEVFQVKPECQVAWMAYTAGDAIPAGAVLGGYRSLGSHSDLYVVRVPDGAHGSYRFGFYDTSSQMGYVAVTGTNNMWQHMHIMILLWLVWYTEMLYQMILVIMINTLVSSAIYWWATIL